MARVLNADELYEVLDTAKKAAERDGDHTSAAEIERATEALLPFAAGYIATALAEVL